MTTEETLRQIIQRQDETIALQNQIIQTQKQTISESLESMIKIRENLLNPNRE